jgi:cytosine/uracil/thiamine/allantoin permease
VSPQLQHALRQYLIMLAAAVLAFVVENQTNFVETIFANLNLAPEVIAVIKPTVIAAVAGLVRAAEGFLDAKRAEQGKVIEADVAYGYLEQLAANPSVPQVEAAGDTIYVESPDVQVIDIGRNYD